MRCIARRCEKEETSEGNIMLQVCKNRFVTANEEDPDRIGSHAFRGGRCGMFKSGTDDRRSSRITSV